MSILIENDWLGSKPLFISKSRNIGSRLIGELVQNREPISMEGLSLFLSFGYSVLQKTIFEDIEYTQPGESIELDTFGKIVRRKTIGRPFQHIDANQSSNEAIQEIEAWVNRWESSFDGDIIIPLSGGFDSRLLLSFIRDKTRVYAYTYGLTTNPKFSHEVRIAKRIASINNVKWKLINLHGFHRHLETWDSLFGASTHAHGMYQIEFYDQISKLHDHKARVLSGIVGDMWAGSTKFEEIKRPRDVIKLAHSHGLSDVSLDRSYIKDSIEFLDQVPSLIKYFETNREILRDERMRIVESMRMKMMLLRYLILVPNYFNFITESPFLDSQIAQRMLSIRKEEWENRKWQRDFFERNRLNSKWVFLFSTQNSLNLNSIVQGDVPSVTITSSNFIALPTIDHNSFYKQHRFSIATWAQVSRFNLLSLSWIKMKKKVLKKPTNAERLIKLYIKFLLIYPIRKYI
jgi:hypothetical protein